MVCGPVLRRFHSPPRAISRPSTSFPNSLKLGHRNPSSQQACILKVHRWTLVGHCVERNKSSTRTTSGTLGPVCRRWSRCGIETWWEMVSIRVRRVRRFLYSCHKRPTVCCNDTSGRMAPTIRSNCFLRSYISATWLSYNKIINTLLGDNIQYVYF